MTTGGAAAATRTRVQPHAATRVRVLPHAALCPQGAEIDAARGTLLDALLGHGIAVEHACEKVGACATCHVHIREGAARLAPADEDEDDRLGSAWGLDADSRLACCVRLPKGGGELVVELPRFTRNHAREG
jgi:2Fe-2S ferredoxin